MHVSEIAFFFFFMLYTIRMFRVISRRVISARYIDMALR
jgi:hypothetical protein